MNFVDAPVSGGTVGAQNGTLTFMCGVKNPEVFASAKPILEAMGKNIVYVGENGHGLAAKICNNMMLGISMIGVAETMNLGIKSVNLTESIHHFEGKTKYKPNDFCFVF